VNGQTATARAVTDPFPATPTADSKIEAKVDVPNPLLQPRGFRDDRRRRFAALVRGHGPLTTGFAVEGGNETPPRQRIPSVGCDLVLNAPGAARSFHMQIEDRCSFCHSCVVGDDAGEIAAEA
jgi:hypothetical protein